MVGLTRAWRAPKTEEGRPAAAPQKKKKKKTAGVVG
jgi:hypothetical protein